MSENTRLAYDSAVRCHNIPRVGDVALDHVTVAIVEDLLDRAAAEPSPATGRRMSARMVGVVHETLRSALATAMRRELIGRNPAELAEAPRRVRHEVDPLLRDEARAFVAAASADRLAALWLVALGCGLRKGEALALRWPDIDLDAGAMRVGSSLVRRNRRWLLTRGKGKPVMLALPGFAITALRAHWRTQAEERMAAGPYWQPVTVDTPAGPRLLDDLVFTTPEGAPIESSAVNTWLHEACDRAGMRRMSPHELRHQCASLLLTQGATMAEVQLTLRHASQAITSSTYAHLHDEVRREWADRMDGLLGGESPR